MEKEFRVNVVPPGKPECLVLLIRAASLNGAIRKLRYSTEFQLPIAQYYVYETGHYANGISIALMRDEAAIPHLTRTEQGCGTVRYFFGNTTIQAIEAQVAGNIRLTPVSGDQAACGEWVELDEEQVRRYCDLLAQHLNSGAGARSKTAAEAAKGVQEDR